MFIVKKNTVRIAISILVLFSAAAPSYSARVYILCYHSFLEKKDPYTFSAEQFREQMVKLKNAGFNFVTFDDVLKNRMSGNNNVLISIDDGNHTVYPVYHSILKPMGIKPMLAIYPAIISRVNYAMTWDQVKELSDDGCYIASHGYHHMFLSEKYFKEEPASFRKEIYLSKKILEEKLNRKIEVMVYPFGVKSPIAISELKKAGYRYGMTIEPHGTQLPVHNNFQVSRFLMTKESEKGFISLITRKAGLAESEKKKCDVKISKSKNRKFLARKGS